MQKKHNLRSCFEIIALVIYTTFPAIFTFLIGRSTKK